MKGGLKILLAAGILFCPGALPALDVPPLKGYVNDYADMISPAAEAAIESELRAFEQSDSTQVVILTVPSLEGDVLEDYTIRVAETWKIGQKKKDNGVIFFAAKNDRVMRIEVGRGLEGVLTDLLSGRILDNIVRPGFKAGNFDTGFSEGVSAIVKACRGEFINDGPPDRSDVERPLSAYMVFLLIIFYFVSVLLQKFSRIAGGIAGALFLPVIVHFAVLPLGIAGFIITAVIGFFVSLVSPYIPIGGGSGGGRWSSSGGGGFSGGGGSFGGGGASGGW